MEKEDINYKCAIPVSIRISCLLYKLLGGPRPQIHRWRWKNVYSIISIDVWLWHGAHCIRTRHVEWYMNIIAKL
jgi:hypothetical protein